MDRTRIVRWLRVLLPLLALAILSTLFLFSRRPDAEPNIPYADVDQTALPGSQSMRAPEYSGTTDDGAAITLRADQATPASGEGDAAGRAQGLRLTWRAPEGLGADLTAPDAAVSRGVVTLSGGVRMTTSSGWTLTAPEFTADTARSRIEAPRAVRGAAPFGDLSAGAMTLQRGESDRDHVLNFTGGVRLLYRP